MSPRELSGAAAPVCGKAPVTLDDFHAHQSATAVNYGIASQFTGGGY